MFVRFLYIYSAAKAASLIREAHSFECWSTAGVKKSPLSDIYYSGEKSRASLLIANYKIPTLPSRCQYGSSDNG